MTDTTTEPTAPPIDDQQLAELSPRAEAILMSIDRPLQADRIAAALGLITIAQDDEDSDSDQSPPAPKPRSRPSSPKAVEKACATVAQVVTHLNAQYEQTGRSFRIESVAGGLRVMTLPEFADTLAAFQRLRTGGKLTRAGVETLAIIAYKQPITRAQLEAIRGVSCGEVLRSLMDRRLVTVKGRAEELGRPMLYGTTRQFLDHFGLAGIKDLPTLAELRPVV
jgi:segregation and condensation protein B